jgi:hypothetical protein
MFGKDHCVTHSASVVDFDEDDCLFNSDESRNNGSNHVVIHQDSLSWYIEQRESFKAFCKE